MFDYRPITEHQEPSSSPFSYNNQVFSCISYNDNGGAIDASNKEGTFTNCNFYYCQATGDSKDGGAIYYKGSSSSIGITQCLFYNCLASRYGGAIYAYQSSLAIQKSDFIACSSGSTGGSIDFWGTSSNSLFQVSSTSFTASKAEGSSTKGGGGIHAEFWDSPLISSSSFLISSIFYGNEAKNGGGIYMVPGSAQSISECVFKENKASSYGGAIYWKLHSSQSNQAGIISCLFASNTALNSYGSAQDVYIDNIPMSFEMSTNFFSNSYTKTSSKAVYADDDITSSSDPFYLQYATSFTGTGTAYTNYNSLPQSPSTIVSQYESQYSCGGTTFALP